MPESQRPRVRFLWSGNISFGLVTIPVSFLPAVRPGRVSMRLLDEEGTPLSRRYYCPEDEREIARDEIVRGFPTREGEFILVEDEELEALEPEKTQEIDLRQFVNIDRVEPFFFVRPYFLAPNKGGSKAYRLLAEVMDREKKAGLGRFVMRGTEYLVVILSENGVLRAQTLRFPDEIRDPKNLGLPEAQTSKKIVNEMKSAIRKRTRSKLSDAELKDGYTERLQHLVTQKKKRDEGVVVAEQAAEEREPEQTQIIDLMEYLKQSLSQDESVETQDGDLEALTKEELYQKAQELDIQGRSKMSKSELLDSIKRRVG